MEPSSSSSSLTPYQLLEKAGSNLKPLKQIHAYLITSKTNHIKSLLTKLAILACSTRNSSSYTRNLALSTPNPDSYLFNSLIRISSKLGSCRNSRNDVFFYYNQMILLGLPLSSYTFTGVIKGCGGDGHGLRVGKRVHYHVVVNGFGSDLFVQAGLVMFYAKCGEVKVARKVFDEMPEKSIVAWNSMISGYEQNGMAKEAIEVFRLMREEGVEPDSVTFVGVVSACAQLGGIELGSWVHECIVEYGVKIDVVLGTALINMYSQCGNVKKARGVFNEMNERNVVTWTTMISGYGVHGYGKEALNLYESMKSHKLLPNEITFVAVLSACAHAGMIDEGRRIFLSMTRDYGVKPGVEHHVCMVDLLGRAGLLNEAYDHVKKLKKPGSAIWTALLGACKMHKNVDLGVEVAEKLFSIEPENPAHYVMLSNVYASAGKMEKVEMIRNVMIKNRLKKRVGYSTIEVDQNVHLFSMGDKSHSETREIYKYLDDLMARISEAGYVPAHESVLHELEEEEIEFALRYHSEKLAIAFGLMKGEGDECGVIRVVKNLRMCEDCHLAIKFISSVIGKEIIVRDKLRFHHFKDGLCSCGDYW